jgi:hypothetical protein
MAVGVSRLTSETSPTTGRQGQFNAVEDLRTADYPFDPLGGAKGAVTGNDCRLVHAANANDALRIDPARALTLARAELVIEVMKNLVEDPNPPVRLIAASSILVAAPDNARCGGLPCQIISSSPAEVQSNSDRVTSRLRAPPCTTNALSTASRRKAAPIARY